MQGVFYQLVLLTVITSLQVNSSKPIQVTVGTSPVISPGASDWPESLYICPLPDQEEESVNVKVVFEELEAIVTVTKGM